MILTYHICAILVAILVFFLKVTFSNSATIEILLKAAGKLVPLFVIVIAIVNIFDLTPKQIVKSTDYQIVCGQENLIIMDSTATIGLIPYSDSSDIWKIIINNNK